MENLFGETQVVTTGHPDAPQTIEVSTPRRPVARQAQRAGLAAINKQRPKVKDFVLQALKAAGPVTRRNGVVIGGLTFRELASEVSDLRGKQTDRCTMTQPVKDLRGEGLVRDSGHLRMIGSKTGNTIWEYIG